MALITEDGSGLPNAESYCSVADASAYHAARGNATWGSLAESVQEQLLRKATDYMGVYSSAWQGQRAVAGQALDWPRIGVVAYGQSVAADVVPAAVRNACASLALTANSGPLAPDATQAVKRKKVGPLEIEYQDYSSATKRYTSIDTALAAYLGAGCGRYMVPLERS